MFFLCDRCKGAIFFCSALDPAFEELCDDEESLSLEEDESEPLDDEPDVELSVLEAEDESVDEAWLGGY